MIGLKLYFWLVVALALSLPASTFAQISTGTIQVSILTCTPGDALYSTFGHSAFRVIHQGVGTDVVFDFGVFDFDEPFFIWKFLRGNLQYHVASRSFKDFAASYQSEGRGMIEQRLNLSQDEMNVLYLELVQNCRPENRHYHYEFLTNNCSTRIRDLLIRWGSEWQSKQGVAVARTYRSCLHSYLRNRPWIKFGVDLILGSPTDRKINFADQMFLPNQLSANFAEIFHHKSMIRFAAPAKLLLQSKDKVTVRHTFFTPFFCFLLLGLSWIFARLWKPTTSKQCLKWVRILLGLGGLFLIFMWIGTSHPSTKINFNLVWLNPLYLLVVFSKVARVKAFTLIILLVLNGLLLLTWNVLPQQLNMGSISIVICMIVANLMELARGRPQQD